MFMKTPNLRKLEYYLKSIKQGVEKEKCLTPERYNQYLVWNPFASITALELYQPVVLLEDQDASIAAFISSALFHLMSLIFLLSMLHALWHTCQTQGPRAKSGPPWPFMWPSKL